MENVKKDLIKKAKMILENAYAPYSKFRVGCAILGENDKIYLGVNCENASFGATICAERSAAASAVTDGAKFFKVIAIAAGESPTSPCGICRQFLSEFTDPETLVLYSDAEGKKVIETTMGALLPEAFSKTNLDGDKN